MKNQSFVLIGITILLVFGVPGIESDVFCQLGLPSGSQIPVSSGSVTEINGQVFSWNLCEGLTTKGSCNGAGVCIADGDGDEKNGGYVPEIQEKPDQVVLNLKEGGDCNGAKIHTQIQFNCGHGRKLPKIKEETLCNFVFIFQSREYCTTSEGIQKVSAEQQESPHLEKREKEEKSASPELALPEMTLPEFREKLVSFEKRLSTLEGHGSERGEKSIEGVHRSERKTERKRRGSCKIETSGITLDLSEYGELSKTIDGDKYTLNFCEGIDDTEACEGANVCLKKKEGKNKSLGQSPRMSEGQVIFTDGSTGCGGVRETTVTFLAGPNREILSVTEKACFYEIVVTHPSIPYCTVVLKKQLGAHPCKKGVTFDCTGDSMWTESCKGDFICNNNKIRCVSSLNEKTKCFCNS